MALATSTFIYTPLMTWLLSYLQSSILFLDNCSLIGFFKASVKILEMVFVTSPSIYIFDLVL